MIALNEINMQRNLANKMIIAESHINIKGGFYYKLNNGACMTMPYPTVEVKHI